jgi:quinoprotein glucose dehydrogenase
MPRLLALLLLSLPLFAQNNQDWPVYGGNFDNTHYSLLAQINRDNVKNLQIAWSFDTGASGGLQTSPIIVDTVLYGITPSQKIFALDAATGKLLWKFDSGVSGTQPDRGLAYWSDGRDKRILVGIMHFVYALDAATGKPILSFGQNGRIDLREGLGREPASEQFVALTSPPTIYKDLFIVGGRNPETLPAPSGDIRAFDARTGKLRWAFHTIPRPGEFGYDTWPRDAWKTSGAANNWTGMTVDVALGIVYVPTGSSSADFYGADRLGDDLFANCLLALDAATGQRLWHFQGVHHDIWDRDFPSPPLLVNVQRDGKSIAAVAQPSKQGFVYLFDRANGAPLFPIEARDYPASSVPGEASARQQALPTKPAPFARQLLTEDLLTTRTPAAHQWALAKFNAAISAGQFVPLNIGKDTVIFPGFDGGAEWGGSALDPDTAVLYVNANDIAWLASLAETSTDKTAQSLYKNQCATCHGETRAGSPPNFPSLLGIAGRLSPEKIEKTISEGKGRMPGFPNFSGEQIDALIEFLSTSKDTTLIAEGPPLLANKYHLTGYRRFYDPDGYPAVAPPWGTLNAINLNTGEYLWRIPLGEYPELAAQGLKNTGTENYDGLIVTAGGLLFIGATNFDKKFRAFDPKSPSGGLYISFALPPKM